MRPPVAVVPARCRRGQPHRLSLIDQRDPRPAVADTEVIGDGDAGYAGADDGDLEFLGVCQDETPRLPHGRRMLCWLRAEGQLPSPRPSPASGRGEVRSRRDMAEDSDEYDEEIAEPAPPAEVPEPRANPYLAGHEAAEASLIEAHAQGKLPHAIIIR